MTPSPESARIGRNYVGTAASDYLAYQGQIGVLGADLNLFKFQRHVDSNDAVVDFGCGTGGLLGRLQAGSKTGIEANSLARAEARKLGIPVVASADELEDGCADVVISNHALEHTLSPFVELTALRRLLRSGGKLVLWLPFDDWRTQRRPGDDPDHHLFTWTPLLLRNLLEEAGFRVLETRVVAHAWPPFTAKFARLPPSAFDAVCKVWSVARRRRQVMAIAVRPN